MAFMLSLFKEINAYLVRMCFNFCCETLWYPRREELSLNGLPCTCMIYLVSVFAAVRNIKEELAFVASEEVKGSCGAY